MAFASTQVVARPRAAVAPFYGVAKDPVVKDSNFVLSLQHRGDRPKRESAFTLTSGPGEFYFYAYPKIFGTALFVEVDAHGKPIGVGNGSWDGAAGDPFTKHGPIIISDVHANGVVQPFYLYRSDWPCLGTSHWKVV